MKPRYLSVACIITAFSMMILMATLPLIAPQQAHASPASLPENVHLVEEGIVANPEVLEQDITQLNADDSDDILWEGYLSGELQLSLRHGRIQHTQQPSQHTQQAAISSKRHAHQPITKSSPQQDQAYLETATITLAGQVQVTTTMEPQWADTAMPA